jgi:foldase protein PrsA
MNKLKETIKKVKGFMKKIFHFKKPTFLSKLKLPKLKFPKLADLKKVKVNKLGMGLIALAIVLGALFYFKSFFIAATVNGQPISRFEILKRLEKTDGKTALDNVITEILVVQEAKKLNVLATDAEINTEIAKVEEQLKASNQTLEAVLLAQRVSMNEFRYRIMLQKTVEKILDAKAVVTEEEISKFIEDNKASIPEGMQQSEVRTLVQEQLKTQKLGTEFQTWLEMVKGKANINYLVKYE